MDEIHYLLGNTCNLTCDFCFWEKEENSASLGTAKHIIDEIKKAGVKKVTISGGEPTCSHCFLEALKYAKKKGLEVFLHTNGLLVDKKLAKKIAPLVARVSLSIDGSNEKMAIRMRKKPFTNHTIFLINTFDSLGVPVNVKTLVSKVNKEDIKSIGELLQGKPIQYWSLLEFNPIGRGLNSKARHFLSHRDFELTVKRITEWFPDMQIRIREFRSKPEKYCLISASGKVYAYLPRKGDVLVGDLKDNVLSTIIRQIDSN
jgi:MoaA/NifB/PqqE/SkfB family radical SAM enzyme